MKYIHFTDLEGARAIVKTNYIKAAGSPFPEAVFAVVEGGAYVPGVQQTKLGRAKNRKVAVVFTTQHLPDKGFPEEVIWHVNKLPVQVIDVMLAKNAIEKYLNDSISRDSETEQLKIPLHLIEWDEDKNNWKRL